MAHNDSKLKMFVLKELRENNQNKWFRLFKDGNFYIQEPTHYSVANPRLIISFSNDKKCIEAESDKYNIWNYLKPIVCFAKNIEVSHHGVRVYYPLDIKFKFDLESWEDVDISNVNEDLDVFNEWKNKIIEDYNNWDIPWTISCCKTFLESIYKHILDKKGIKYKDDEKFPALTKKVLDILELKVSAKTSEGKKIFISGINSINKGINEIRNELWDWHGDNPEKVKELLPHNSIKLLVETTISLWAYLYSEYKSIM